MALASACDLICFISVSCVLCLPHCRFVYSETKYHMLNAMVVIKKGELKMLEDEENYSNKNSTASLGHVHKTYKAQNDAHIQQNKQKIITLNERRQNFSANSSSYEFQRKRFDELRKLLKLKSRVNARDQMMEQVEQESTKIGVHVSGIEGHQGDMNYNSTANIMRIE